VVILVSRPLIGETVKLIKKTVSSQDWKSAFIYTTVSTSTHYHLHGSVAVSEAAFYQQFSDKLLETSVSLQKCATKALPSLRSLSFSNNNFSNDCFELVQSHIRPLFQSQIHRIGSPNVPGFSFHNLPKQDQIEILSFAAVLAEKQSGVEMTFWAAGEISKIVAERLLQTNSKSDLNKQAVLLFDRQIEFGKEQLEQTAADFIFSSGNPLLPKTVNSDLGYSLLLPKDAENVKLFHSIKTESVDYSKMIVEKSLAKEGKVTGNLSEMIEKIKKKRLFCLEHGELLSIAQLLSNSSPQTALSFNQLKCRITSYPQNAPVELLVADYLHYLSTFDLTRVSSETREEFQILEAAFSLFLNNCNHEQRSKTFPIFYLKHDASLDEIRARVEQRFGQLKADIALCNKKYGTYGCAQFLETLFMGMPVPNFMEKIEDGLIGKLSSGFGLFGGGGAAKPSHPKEFSRILVVVIGGLTFAETKQIKNLEGKFDVDIQIVTNTVYTPKTMIHHLS